MMKQIHPDFIKSLSAQAKHQEAISAASTLIKLHPNSIQRFPRKLT
jgi:hypothetical protein